MKLFTPDTENIEDYYERGKFLLGWRIAITFTIFFTLIFIVNSITNPSGLFPISLVLITALSGLYYLKKSNKIRLVFWIFSISGSITPILAMNFVLEYTHFVDFIWLPTCLLVAYIGLGKKEGLFFVIIDIIGIGLFYIFNLNKHIQILQPRTNVELIADYAEIVFAILIMVYVLIQFVKFQTYAETEIRNKNKHLQEQNRIISLKNIENENLLKEIHHRVKNNLQIIISLLRMQSSEMKSDEAKNHFKEAISRIMTMSLIHQKLYSEKEISKINLQSYFKELIDEIVSVNSIQPHKIKLDLNTNIPSIDLTSLVPLGLLLNELVSNSLKHSLQKLENPSIKINIIENESNIIFHYEDNGVWMPPKEDSYSFGIELIDILTEQMNGKKTMNTETGVIYDFVLERS